MTSALSKPQRIRIKVALGYPIKTTAPSLAYGIPVTRSTNFLVEKGMDNVDADGLAVVLDALGKVESLKEQIFQATCQLKVDQVDQIKLAGGDGSTDLVTDRLRVEKDYWVAELADKIGCTPYEYRQTRRFTHRRSINRRVRG